MSTAAKKENTVVLVTSDEGTYTVERAVAEKSGLVKTMMEGECSIPSLMDPIHICDRRTFGRMVDWSGWLDVIRLHAIASYHLMMWPRAR